MSARDWFNALLDAAPDLKLPPACPFGQEDETASNYCERKRFQYANTVWCQVNLNHDTDEHVAILSASTPSDMTIESTKLGDTNTNEVDDITKRDTLAQPDLQTENLHTRDDAGPPTPQTDEMNLKPTPDHLAHPTHHGEASYSSAHVDLPIAAQPSHYKSSNTSLPVSGQQAKKGPANDAAKGKGANEVILTPIDYGKKCDVCKVHSIWKRTATLCFNCLGNSPSQAKRQEVIRRALVGIGSCSSCYKAEDNGADRHCLSCTQRQRDKNARRKARKARGETWVPKGRKHGGTKTSKCKRSSKPAAAGKLPKTN